MPLAASRAGALSPDSLHGTVQQKTITREKQRDLVQKETIKLAKDRWGLHRTLADRRQPRNSPPSTIVPPRGVNNVLGSRSFLPDSRTTPVLLLSGVTVVTDGHIIRSDLLCPVQLSSRLLRRSRKSPGPFSAPW